MCDIVVSVVSFAVLSLFVTFVCSFLLIVGVCYR